MEVNGEFNEDLLPPNHGPIYKDERNCMGSGKLPNIQVGLQSNGMVPKSTEVEKVVPRVFVRRWLMLGLFCFYSLSNAYQWIHLNIIYDVLDHFYNESLPVDSYQRQVTIDWLSMLYMLAYIPLIFPATWILDKKGLRVCGLLGAFLNCAGAWIKCASIAEDRFGVLMFAQSICAIAQIFVLGIPARLAAVWFGPNEVSTATALGVFGNQVGVAVGFLVPPLLVPNSNTTAEIADDLKIMFYSTAGTTTLVFLLMIFVFKKEPPVPPSKAQAIMVDEACNENYVDSLKKLLRNRNFLILTLTYGINTGSYYAIGTLLNPVYLMEHITMQGAGVVAGKIGLTIVIAGIGGSIVAGIWLDKTKWFKATTLAIYCLSFGCMIAFTFTIPLALPWLHYIVGALLGFFMTGYLPVGFEFAAEITYPSSEGTSSGILNASAQFFGIIFTLTMGALLVQAKAGMVDTRTADIILSGALLLGTIATAFIKSDLRRQKAEKDDDEDEKDEQRQNLTNGGGNYSVAQRLTQL